MGRGEVGEYGAVSAERWRVEGSGLGKDSRLWRDTVAFSFGRLHTSQSQTL